MLRLSKKADYALIAMKHLAVRDNGAVSSSAREIAEQYDIPIELMAKVLQRLVRTGLLVSTQGTRWKFTWVCVNCGQMSTQGTRGGYTLSRPSALISVANVVEAIDGPFTVTACSSDKHDCEQYGKCSVRGPLWQIRERIVATLGTVTLADMADDHEATFTAPVAVVRRGA